jgi:hypothetical protein
MAGVTYGTAARRPVAGCIRPDLSLRFHAVLLQKSVQVQLFGSHAFALHYVRPVFGFADLQKFPPALISRFGPHYLRTALCNVCLEGFQLRIQRFNRMPLDVLGPLAPCASGR